MATDSLQQYLTLYRENRETLDRGSAEVLNARREEAYAALERAGRLPDRSDEGFEKTSIADMFAPDYGVNIARVDIPVDALASFKCDVPHLSTLLAIVANDKFVPTATLLKNLPEGVEVMSLAEAARKHPEEVASAYGSVAPIANSGVALNTLLVQDGVYIHIGRGIKLQRPIQIVNIFHSETPLMAFRRMLVVADEGAEGEILVCDHSQKTGADYLASTVTEVICRRNSHVEIIDMEESGAATSRYSQLFVRQADDSAFRAVSATLLNGSTRNEYAIAVDGNNCSTGLYGMAIGSDKQHIDNSSAVTHRGERSTSNQSFRYVLDDEATGAFEGGIEVSAGARFTEAYQSNNNVLASEGARMHTKPQLLIYCDDVKCSHGATVGRLNDEQLFYMQTRGIPIEEARTMLMQAFMSDVIDMVGVEGVRDRLRHLVEKRFAGTLASCSGCGAC